MKRLLGMGIFFFCLLALTACSTPYRMLLKNGSAIMTTDEPEYDHRTGFYEYKAQDGKKARVNKDEVVEIKEL